jgi:AcrR family transcriptional regulator
MTVTGGCEEGCRRMDAEPRSAKGKRTRARLVEAGKRVFERDGFLQARISDIAAEADVSHGAFYHYFDSKETLFRDIAASAAVRLVSIDDVGKDGEQPAGTIDRIRAANLSFLTAYEAQAGIMRVIEEVTRYDADVRRVREERRREFSARLEASIARLQADGVADPRVDKRYGAQALSGMVARFAEDLFFGGIPFEMEMAVEQLTLLWANALGIRDNVARPASAEVHVA